MRTLAIGPDPAQRPSWERLLVGVQVACSE